jgi:membrane fusion protein, multidrug efflux system
MTKQILIFLSVAALVVSCNPKQDELGKDITIPVSVMEVKPKSIEKFIDFTGNVKPVQEVQLKSEISGNYRLLPNPITGRLFILGDQVKEGQEIIALEDKEYENNIKLSSLKLNLEITKQVFDKQQSLFDKGGVTLSELKNAEISYINAKYSYDDALLRLQKMRIKAPFTGTITDLPYYTPNVRTDASSSMVKIMDYSKLFMELNLPEKYMAVIKPGQVVKITNYTFPNDTLLGTISQLSPAIDADTRSFKGIVLVNNPKLLLRPGMYAKGNIVVASGKNALVIPKEIILSKQQGNVVYVVDKGRANERYVQFGLENPSEVEIISGLKKGDRVVIKGYETLRDGANIKVMK